MDCPPITSHFLLRVVSRERLRTSLEGFRGGSRINADLLVRKGYPQYGQYRKLVEYCPELWFRVLVEVGRTYGWRVSELLSIRVSQIDLFSRTIRLEPGTTKNNDGREVTMTDAVYTLLAECIHGKAPDQYVLTRPCGNPVRDFRDTWANACKHANVIGLLFHDLGRTAARNLRRAGIAEDVIMKNENRRMANAIGVRALCYRGSERHRGGDEKAPGERARSR